MLTGVNSTGAREPDSFPPNELNHAWCEMDLKSEYSEPATPPVDPYSDAYNAPPGMTAA